MKAVVLLAVFGLVAARPELPPQVDLTAPPANGGSQPHDHLQYHPPDHDVYIPPSSPFYDTPKREYAKTTPPPTTYGPPPPEYGTPTTTTPAPDVGYNYPTPPVYRTPKPEYQTYHTIKSTPTYTATPQTKYLPPTTTKPPPTYVAPPAYNVIEYDTSKTYGPPPAPEYDAHTQEPAPYKYKYSVGDPYAGVNFGHEEGRHGGAANGEYRVPLPDGRTIAVTYTADHNGYRPEIVFE